MAKKTKQHKQPPPKRMTTKRYKARTKRDSAVIQGTPLTRQQLRAQERKLAKRPRSEALEAMSDAHLSPPVTKEALAPTVTVIRSGGAGDSWKPPEPHFRQPEDDAKTSAARETAESRKLETLITSLEKQFRVSRAPKKIYKERAVRRSKTTTKEKPHGKAKRSPKA